VREDLRKHLPRWAPQRIETLYNRLDVESVLCQLASRAEARRKLNLPQDAIVIANVGRLHPDKDQATLLKGFAAALPNLPVGSLLTIIGRGALEDELKYLARQLGIAGSVRFPGQVPNVRNYFRAFDLFVLSSDHEPFGLVLLEAMAAGVPILATDCGGAPEVVGNANQLFGLGDAEELARKILGFFFTSNDGERHRISEIASQRLAEFFSDKAARERFASLQMARNLVEM